jgi:hypothetical protein
MSNCSCNSGGSFVQLGNYSQGKSGNNFQRPYATGQLSQPLLSIFNSGNQGYDCGGNYSTMTSAYPAYSKNCGRYAYRVCKK